MKSNNNNLKIAMIGHKHVPSREGGVEIVVEEISTRMAERGYSVTLYNRSGRKEEKYYKGVRIKKAFTINKRGLAALSSSFFASLKAAFSNYDIVHFHAEGPSAMLLLPKLCGKKCIVTIHGLDWDRSKWGGFATRYIKFGEKIAAKYADEIIVLSHNVHDYFKKTYNRETLFIPNGIARAKTHKAEIIKEKYNLEKDSYILFLGRIVPEKGIEYLIKAFKETKTDKKLIIAGGSSDTDSFFKSMKELSKDDERISLIGFVEGQTLEELYSNAYVYTLPSDLEGMPLSLLEAMSYGNCCLTSNIPECTEVTEEHALSFAHSDINDLKEKLQYLIDNPAKVEKYKETASSYITAKYNWERVVDLTLDVYNEALKRYPQKEVETSF